MNIERQNLEEKIMFAFYPTQIVNLLSWAWNIKMNESLELI